MMSLKAVANTVIAGLLLAGVSAAAGAQTLRLQPDQALHARLPALEQRIELDLPEGHVAPVRFTGDGLHLDLRDAQGRHLRRLAANGRGTVTALWRTKGSDQEQQSLGCGLVALLDSARLSDQRLHFCAGAPL